MKLLKLLKGALQSKKIPKSEITLEVGGLVGPGLTRKKFDLG